MEELIEYFSDILNIKTGSTFTIADMVQTLESVNDMIAFKDYIKANANHYDIKFMNGVGKFNWLSKRYLDKQAEEMAAARLPGARTACKELCAKISAIAENVLEDATLKPKQFLQPGTKDQFFTKFEKSEIRAIGGLQVAARLQKSVSGIDALEEKLMERAIKHIQRPKLAHKTENSHNGVSAMLKTATKRI